MYRFIIIFILIFSCGNKNQSHDTLLFPSLFSADNNSIKHQVVAFVYHRIGDERYPSTNTTISDFEAQLKYLKDNDYTVVTLSEALSNSFPNSVKNVVVLTIDDAFKSFYQHGFPLLKKYGLKATLFINTETIGGSSYMDEDEIKEVMGYGLEIGNHSHSHDYFLNINKKERYSRFQEDISLSQKIFQQLFNKAPSVFAYPYGEFDTEMKDIIKKEGFVAAVAQNSGVICQQSDQFALPRFPMSTAFSKSFKEKVDMNPLDIKSISTNNHFWNSTNNKPTLKVGVIENELKLNQLQCFIQGSPCTLSKKELEDHQIEIELTPVNPLTRRRTLYTVTVPDSKNNWYWFSYLWINPDIP